MQPCARSGRCNTERVLCGHLWEVKDLVIRWYARALDAATLLKGAMALAALVALVVGAGAGWRWD
jgi:hypothetical protein